MICGALTWLTYFETHRIEDLESQIKELTQDPDDQDQDDDWIASSVKKAEQDKQRDQLKIELKFLLDKAQKIQKMKKQVNTLSSLNQISESIEDEDLDNTDYEFKREMQALNNGLSTEELDDILDDYDSDPEDETDDFGGIQEKPMDYSLRIYYCSRTHSQLSQFVKEVQKTKFAQDLRLVSLASRANMCINDSVLALKNPTLINEKCLEMQKKKSSKRKEDSSPPRKKAKKSTTCACPYKKSEAISKLRVNALMKVQDIEELVTKGRELKACPYYASRHAVQDAQVVVVPYNTLLHPATREACQINLDNSVVIVDEAHNLLETIASIHSGEILESHLTLAREQLKSYDKKYGNMLSASNKLYIKHLRYVIGKLLCIFKTSQDSCLVHFGDFISQLDLGFNLFKLIKYIESSKLCYKLQSFSKR